MPYKITIHLKEGISKKQAIAIAEEIEDEMLPDYEDSFEEDDIVVEPETE